MYLHKDKDKFRDIVEQVANRTGRSTAVIEKDYYVTLILKLLSEKLNNCVFKGGTSLSKGFHVINRFSEDIDITFDETHWRSQKKKLKNVVLKGIGDELEMPISNWENTQSDRDYNAYLFGYDSVMGVEYDRILQNVKLETALGSYAFPTKIVTIDNYIGNYFKERNREDLAVQFSLEDFLMKLQSLERTYIDKIFALCDYYIQGRNKRCSRHLYDIYKLTPRIKFDDDFAKLYVEVRTHRAKMSICPSAQPGINVSDLINEFCDNGFYKEDYRTITYYFSEDMVAYEDAIRQMRKLAELRIISSEKA